MMAYISHSQQDQAAFTSLCLALEGQAIRYWEPRTMMVGASLKEQLRDAINACDVCVFVATRKSLDSKWCAAEIGAFWGIGKRVIVFLAETDISQTDIPPQFQGDLWTHDVREVVRVAKAELTAATERRKRVAILKPVLVSQLSVTGLYEILAWMRSEPSGEPSAADAVVRLRECISSAPRPIQEEHIADTQGLALPFLHALLGAPAAVVRGLCEQRWSYAFTLTADSGEWSGFATEMIRAASVDGYERCLLLQCQNDKVTSATLTSSVWERDNALGLGHILARVGAKAVGTPTKLHWK